MAAIRAPYDANTGKHYAIIYMDSVSIKLSIKGSFRLITEWLYLHNSYFIDYTTT